MFLIDNMSKTPVYTQIIEQMHKYILGNIIKPNEQIPSVRSLSTELCVNPNTIQKAYTELERQGLIYPVPGKGSFISENAQSLLINLKSGKFNELELIVKELKSIGFEKEKIIESIERCYNDEV